MEPYNVFGEPTGIVQSKGDPVFDLTKPDHVSRLIPFAATQVERISDNKIAVMRGNGIGYTTEPKHPNATTRINITTTKMKRNKRVCVADALLPLIENGTMHFSADEKAIIYKTIVDKRKKDSDRQQKHRTIVKAKLRI
jgi:hypothetical protein